MTIEQPGLGSVDGISLISSTGARRFFPFVNTDTARGDALIAAVAAAAAGDTISLGPGAYKIAVDIDLLDRQTFLLNGARIYHDAAFDTINIFTANNVAGWSIIGPGTLEGSGSALDDDGEHAVAAIDCENFRIFGITAKEFRSAAFYLNHEGVELDAAFTYGSLVGCSAEHCYIGVDFNNRAEYNRVTNFHSTSCVIGMRVTGGNNTVSDYISTGDTYGIWLTTGTNPGHGVFSNCEVNHSTFRAVYVNELAALYGYNFNNCQFRAGKEIELKDCGGINFNGCVLDDATDIIATGTLVGVNKFNDAYFPGDDPTVTASGANRALIKFLRPTRVDGSLSPLADAEQLAVRTLATLPNVAASAGGLIIVSDEAGGYVPAFSDGTNWRRVTDRAIVS